jgi:hypothetical protein
MRPTTERVGGPMLGPGRHADRPGERVLARRCGHCGAVFEPTRHQKHCRPSCRIAAFKLRREQAELAGTASTSDGDRLAGLFE